MQVYGWKPEPFSDEALNDTDNEMAQQAHKLLGSRLNDSYIGVTCEGEVCCHLRQCTHKCTHGHR